MKYWIATFMLTISMNLFSQSLSDKIDQYISSYTQTNDFSGNVLIVQKDSVVFAKSYGDANVAFQVQNQEMTRFKIGSISKQFTAAAIMKLEEAGKLQITDTLSKYFPQYPNAKQVTIHQLLTHTSGVVDIFALPDFSQLSCSNTSLSELAGLLLSHQLESTNQYQYSNGGYAVLAQLIEQVSGKDYGDYLKATIFDTLEMNATGHDQQGVIVENLAVGYNPKGYDGLELAKQVDSELMKGSGSLYSTTQDLLKWINALQKGTFFSQAQTDTFFKDDGNGYGYGISVYKSFGRDVFGHDGRINGYIADYLHYKDDDISVIILGNIQTGVADFLRRDLAAILFDKEYHSRAKTFAGADQYPPNAEDLLGGYAFGPNFTVYVEYVGGLIKARANEGGYSELVPLQDGRFFSRTLYAFIDFVADDNGRVEKMIWTNNDGNVFEGIKK
ncbi:serine hydrolase domain-containing protein [Limibacter armeniacum]|uniref:serine hydrolase domain-containing protein n=1 Tax=Limibacter armeniacum TaxID=466084 RepID=UPI002FE52BA7